MRDGKAGLEPEESLRGRRLLATKLYQPRRSSVPALEKFIVVHLIYNNLPMSIPVWREPACVATYTSIAWL